MLSEKDKNSWRKAIKNAEKERNKPNSAANRYSKIEPYEQSKEKTTSTTRPKQGEVGSFIPLESSDPIRNYVAEEAKIALKRDNIPTGTAPKTKLNLKTPTQMFEKSSVNDAFSSFAPTYKGQVTRDTIHKEYTDTVQRNKKMFGDLNLSNDNDYYDVTPQQVQTLLDKAVTERDYLSRNAVDNLDKYPNWADRNEELKKKISNYKTFIYSYQYTGKAATGDSLRTDEEYARKMRSLTPEGAKAVEMGNRKLAEDKSLSESERARLLNVADNYSDIYLQLKYDGLKNKPDYSVKSQPTTFHDKMFLNSKITDLMTQEEINNYIYLGHTDNKSAGQYLADINSKLQKKQAQKMYNEAKELGEEHPIWGTVQSVIASPVTGMMAASAYIGSAVKGRVDPLDPMTAASQYYPTAKQSVINNIDSQFGKTAYSILTSTAEAGVAAIVGGAVGSGVGTAFRLSEKAVSKITSTVVSGLMSSNVAMDGALQAKARGKSDAQSLVIGGVLGGISWLTEKFSIEQIMKEPTGIKQALKKAAIAEGTEEWTENWADRIVDIIAYQNDNELRTSYNNYIEQGKTPNEALAQVALNIIGEDAEATLAGAISGLGLVGGGIGVNRAKYNNAVKSISDMAEHAKKYFGKDSEAYKKAEDINKKTQNGEKVSNKEAGEFAVSFHEQYQKEVSQDKEKIDMALNTDSIDTTVIESVLKDIGVKNPHQAAVEIEDFKKTGTAGESFNDSKVLEVVDGLTDKGYLSNSEQKKTAGTTTDTSESQSITKNQLMAMVKSLGKKGSESLNTVRAIEKKNGSDFSEGELLREYNRYYINALNGKDRKSLNKIYGDRLSMESRDIAFKAGQEDRAENLKVQRNKANAVVVRDGGLIQNEYSDTLDNTQKGYIEGLAKRLGQRVEIVDSLKSANGAEVNGSYKNGFIQLSAKQINESGDAKSAVKFLIGHEMSHSIAELAPKEFRQFQDLAVNYAAKIKDNSISRVVENYVKDRSAAGEDVDVNVASEEIGADVAGCIFDEDFLAHVASNDYSLFDKIKNIVFDLLDKLNIKNYSEIDELKRCYERAVAKAEKLAKSNGVNEFGRNYDSGVGAKFSIAYTTKNVPVVVIKDNIFNGINKSDYIGVAKEKISEFKPAIAIKGRLIKVNAKTVNEYTNSDYTKNIKQYEKVKYIDKLNATGHLDEVVLASTNYVNEDLKHERKDNFKEFARGNVLMQIGNTKYKANVVVGFTTGNNMVLYDIVNIDNTTFSIKKANDSNREMNNTNPVRTESLADNNSVTQPESIVNTNSMQNSENNTQKNSIGGMKSLLANRSMLAQAQEMKNNHVKKEEILKKTGWYVGIDGKWRYEIDDSKAKFVNEFTSGTKTTLGKVLIHDELYKAYPQLANIPVEFRNMGKYSSGCFDGIIICCDNRLLNDIYFNIYKKAIIHETQHAIQKIENFATGASMNMYYWDNIMPEVEESAKKLPYYNDLSAKQKEELVMALMNIYGAKEKATGMYYNTAGEIESEMAAGRINMSPEERRNQIPYMGNKDTVIRFNDDVNELNDIEKHSVGEMNTLKKIFNANENVQAKYSNQVDKWLRGEFNSDEKFDLGMTPAVLKELGANDLPVMMNMNVIYKMTGGKHGISIDEIKNIPQAMTDPIMVFKSATVNNSFVVLTELTDKSGNDVIAALHLNRFENRLKINRIASVYGKDNIKNYVETQIEMGNLKYIDDKKSQEWSTSRGLYLPKLVQSNPDNNNITHKSDIVNKYTMQNEKNNAQNLKNGEKNSVGEMNPLKQAQADLDYLNETYGVIEPGESPARDIKVPTQNDDGTYNRRYARTAAESEAFTDNQAASILSAVKEGTFSYTREGDNKSWNNAKIRYGKFGYEECMKQWDVLSKSPNALTKNDIAFGEYMLQKAAQKGDSDSVIKLTTEIAAEGTRAGQVVQAMRLLKKMNGAGQLSYIEKTVDGLQNDLDKKKGKKAPQITVPQEMKKKLVEAKDQESIDKAVDDIITNIAEQLPATWMDKWNAWRYLAMLGNPRTHIRNVVGNAIFMPAISIKNTLGAAMEMGIDVTSKIFGKKGIERTKTFAVSPKTIKFANTDYQLMKDILQGGGKQNFEGQIQQKQRVFKFVPLEFMRNLNGNLLEAEDGIFLKAHYVTALSSYLTANKIDVNTLTSHNKDGYKTLEKARNYAIKEAQKATYRDVSDFATGLNYLSHLNKGANIILEAIVPFKKTPANILKRGIEYSPIYIVDTIARGSYKLAKGQINASEFIDRLSTGLTGTGIMLVGYMLAHMGFLRGASKDDEDKFTQWLGRQQYSLCFGDDKKESYSVDWAAPTALPLFVGVELNRLLQKEEKLNVSTVCDAATTLIEPIFEMSMLDGLNSTLESPSKNPDDKAIVAMTREMLNSYFGQAVPTLLGQTTRTFFDDTRRTAYADKNSTTPTWAQYMLQKQKNKIPKLSQQQEPYVNPWGKTEVTPNIWERAFENYASPGYYSKVDTSAMENELVRLYESTGVSIFPKAVGKYFDVDGVRQDLTAKEYTQYQKEVGQKRYALLTELCDSEEYKNLTDETKLDVINKIYEYTNYLGQKDIAPQKDTKDKWKIEAQTAKDTLGMTESEFILNYNNYGSVVYSDGLKTYASKGFDIKNFEKFEEQTKDIKGQTDKYGKTIAGSKQKQIIPIIDSMDISNEEKAYLFSTKWESPKNNPWAEYLR